MADEKDTRTRKSASAKSEQTKAENDAAAQRKAEAEQRKAEKEAKDKEAAEKREAEKKEREEKRAQEKAERDAKKAEEKAAKEKEREEAKAAKEQEKRDARNALLESGDLILADFDGNKLNGDTSDDEAGITFTKAEPKKEEVAQRAAQVISDLQNEATEVPLAGKELADRYGGGTVQWVAFFGMLRVLGLVKAYRFKTGERGQSGLAYLWIGGDEDYSLAPAEDEADEPVAA